MKSVKQKSGNYIKDNFNTTELLSFYVKDFVNDARNEIYSNIKINPKNANFVKHTNILKELATKDLLQFKVKDFVFYQTLEDYVIFTQKITEKKFSLLIAKDKDFSDILYNIAVNDYYNSMINSLPNIFQTAKLTQDIFRFADKELKDLEFYIETVVKNQSFLTARTKLSLFEENDYGLVSSKNLTTLFRINRIIAKRMLLKSASLDEIKESMKLYYIFNENITIKNDKLNFEYVINFNSSKIDKEYLTYWLDLIYEVIPIWYEIKIIY